MSDPFRWTIQLGRWAGVRVRVHLMFLLFVVGALLNACLAKEPSPLTTTAWLGVLVVAIALHELGHALAAVRLGLEPEDVQIWPLGNLTGPLVKSSLRSPEGMLVAAAGLLTSLTLAVASALVLHLFTPAEMVFRPFGNAEGTGAPLLSNGQPAAAFSAVWWLGWFGYINWVLFLANLIPALPLDMGRIFRGLVESTWSGGTGRDPLVGPITARACAFVLALVGVVLLFRGVHAWWALLALAIVLYMMARFESRLMEEGEFFDDSVFGYDFSHGYTSLDSGGDTPDAVREGALHRWRRRRSERRRQRQQLRAAAEEARMDAILDKLYREGRAALSPEEYRFLVRVSAKFKNRTRS